MMEAHLPNKSIDVQQKNSCDNGELVRGMMGRHDVIARHLWIF